MRLGDVAQINPRPQRGLSGSDLVSFMPLSAVSVDGTTTAGIDSLRSDVSKGHPWFICGDILVAKITPSFENGKIARASIAFPEGYSSTEFHIVRPDQKVLDPDYLLAFLRSEGVRRYGAGKMKGSAGQRRLPADVLKSLFVPVPELVLQQSVSSRLRSITALIALSRRQLSLLDELIKSRFVEMFGDPAENPFGYRVASLGETLSVQPTNGLYKPQKDYVADGSGTPIIRIDSFNEHGPNYARLRRLNCSDGELARYGLANGDIVVNRVNSVGCMGKTMLVEGLSEPVVFESNMMRLHVEEALMSPAFLCAQMTSEYSKGYFESHAKRAIGQASINQTDVKALPVLVPSLVLQREYLSFADAVAKSQFVGRTARDCLNCYVRAMRLTAERGRCPCFSSNRLK